MDEEDGRPGARAAKLALWTPHAAFPPIPCKTGNQHRVPQGRIFAPGMNLRASKALLQHEGKNENVPGK